MEKPIPLSSYHHPNPGIPPLLKQQWKISDSQRDTKCSGSYGCFKKIKQFKRSGVYKLIHYLKGEKTNKHAKAERKSPRSTWEEQSLGQPQGKTKAGQPSAVQAVQGAREGRGLRQRHPHPSERATPQFCVSRLSLRRQKLVVEKPITSPRITFKMYVQDGNNPHRQTYPWAPDRLPVRAGGQHWHSTTHLSPLDFSHLRGLGRRSS